MIERSALSAFSRYYVFSSIGIIQALINYVLRNVVIIR
jgi:hypothetical protein